VTEREREKERERERERERAKGKLRASRPFATKLKWKKIQIVITTKK